MKFGLRLRREAIPEWRSQYIDYNSLKRLLKSIPIRDVTSVSAEEISNSSGNLGILYPLI
jgi:SPX domain protein involved in polyphosphate accumulation